MTLLQANALTIPLADQSVHCVVTSPPYWGLRVYDGVPPTEWPAVSYAPMPGLPPLAIAGCDPACDHEWAISVRKRSVGGEREYGSFDGGTGRAPAVKKGVGAYCQQCGGWRGCLGLEPTPEMFVGHLVLIFREVRRVLRDDGVCWVNMGDTYSQDTKWGGKSDHKNYTSVAGGYPVVRNIRADSGLKPKDRMLIPWRVALALQTEGWVLRNEVIWHKPNVLPDSTTDRLTVDHEYVFLLTKACRKRYWTHPHKRGTRQKPKPDYVWQHKQTGERVSYPPVGPRLLREFWRRVNLWQGHDYFFDQDAIREPQTGHTHSRGKGVTPKGKAAERGRNRANNSWQATTNRYTDVPGGRNKRTVWAIATASMSEAHFATFPPALIEPMIQAGTSARGVCPACGAPWERVLEKPTGDRDGRTSTQYPDGSSAKRLARLRQAARAKGHEYVNQTRTIGWTPTCDCPTHDPVPAIVLDPFAGAGTSVMVARNLGRRGIGLDMSLSYLRDIATPRLTTEFGGKPQPAGEPLDKLPLLAWAAWNDPRA